MDCGAGVGPVSRRYRPCEREQQYLMPASLSDWLPEEHFAWYVLEAVEQLDLSAFHAAYRDDGWGRQAYDPAMMLTMMLALLLYAYCEGERSSRANRASLPGGHRLPRAELDRKPRSRDDLPLSATPRAGAGRAVCRGAAALRRGRFGAVPGWWRWTGPSCAPTRVVSAIARRRSWRPKSSACWPKRSRRTPRIRRTWAESGSDALPPELRSRSQRLARLREAQARLAAREQERQDAYEARRAGT